jgi:hypothetical protein
MQEEMRNVCRPLAHASEHFVMFYYIYQSVAKGQTRRGFHRGGGKGYFVLSHPVLTLPVAVYASGTVRSYARRPNSRYEHASIASRRPPSNVVQDPDCGMRVDETIDLGPFPLRSADPGAIVRLSSISSFYIPIKDIFINFQS